MSHRSIFRLVLTLGLVVALLHCSRDPNVRKQKYFESGQRYFEKGKYREAAIQFQNAIQVDPRFGDAHYRLAQTYFKMQDGRRAFQELSRTLETEPENYTARLELVNLVLDYSRSPEDLQQAQENINLLLVKQPNDPLVHEAFAKLMAAQGNNIGAIQEMQKAISLGPGRWEGYLNLGMLQKNTQPDAAESNFKKAAELNPQSVSSQLVLGVFYADRKRFAEAEQRFRHAMQIDPKDPQPRAALARLYLAQGKKAETEDLLKQTKQDLPNDSAAYRMLGDFYFTTGDLDKATAEYGSLYQSHPKDVEVQKNYIQLLILKNQLSEARKLDDELLKLSPNDATALVYRGQIQIRDGHPNDAVQALQNAIKNDPDNAVAHYHLGLAFNQMGDLARAESEWRDAVRLNQDLTEAHRALAATALRKKDVNGLQQSAEQIVRLQPASPDGYTLLALANINRKQFTRAEEDVKKAIEVAPQSPAGYIQMGKLRLAQRQFAEAEKAFQQALERDPSYVPALSGLMETYVQQKQTDKAVAAAKAQILKVPNSSAFYDLLGTVLLQDKKDLEGAQAALRKACDLDKNNADALIKLGEAQVAKGSTDEAIATYQKSIQDNPREPAFYFLLGVLYEAKHDSENAKQAYRKALDLKADDPAASNNLAYLMLETGGNVDLALSLAQTARRGLPESPNAADTLGWVFYQKGAYQSAKDLFEEAQRLSEKTKMADDPTLHYHLGLAYEKLDDPVNARKQLELVLKIAPNYSSASDVRKILSQLRS